MSDEIDLAAIDRRITDIETDLRKLRASLHRANGERQKMVARIFVVEKEVKVVKDNTAEILAVVNGGKKVFGFAIKNWKTMLTFSAGLVTAAGYGNPQVQNILSFITNFFS